MRDVSLFVSYMIFRLPLCMRGSLKTFIAWLG